MTPFGWFCIGCLIGIFLGLVMASSVAHKIFRDNLAEYGLEIRKKGKNKPQNPFFDYDFDDSDYFEPEKISRVKH